MISFDYKPQGVCSRNIHLNLSDDGSKVLGVSLPAAAMATSRPSPNWSRALLPTV